MTTSDDLPSTIESIEQLVRSCDITDVAFHASSAFRLGEESDFFPAAEGMQENAPEMQVMQQRDEAGISTRIRCRLRTPDGFYYVDAAALYEYTVPGAVISENIAMEFAERVGIMAVYPYVRQELHALSAKLGLGTPLLGFLRPGAIRLQREEVEPEQAASS